MSDPNYNPADRLIPTAYTLQHARDDDSDGWTLRNWALQALSGAVFSFWSWCILRSGLLLGVVCRTLMHAYGYTFMPCVGP